MVALSTWVKGTDGFRDQEVEGYLSEEPRELDHIVLGNKERARGYSWKLQETARMWSNGSTGTPVRGTPALWL